MSAALGPVASVLVGVGGVAVASALLALLVGGVRHRRRGG